MPGGCLDCACELTYDVSPAAGCAWCAPSSSRELDGHHDPGDRGCIDDLMHAACYIRAAPRPAASTSCRCPAGTVCRGQQTPRRAAAQLRTRSAHRRGALHRPVRAGVTVTSGSGSGRAGFVIAAGPIAWPSSSLTAAAGISAVSSPLAAGPGWSAPYAAGSSRSGGPAGIPPGAGPMRRQVPSPSRRPHADGPGISDGRRCSQNRPR